MVSLRSIVCGETFFDAELKLFLLFWKEEGHAINWIRPHSLGEAEQGIWGTPPETNRPALLFQRNKLIL